MLDRFSFVARCFCETVVVHEEVFLGPGRILVRRVLLYINITKMHSSCRWYICWVWHDTLFQCTGTRLKSKKCTNPCQVNIKGTLAQTLEYIILLKHQTRQFLSVFFLHTTFSHRRAQATQADKPSNTMKVVVTDLVRDRPLSFIENVYVERGICNLDTILKLQGVRLGSKTRIEQALRMAICASPHLTNTVVPSSPGKEFSYVFQYNALREKAHWQKPNFVECKAGTNNIEAFEKVRHVHLKQLDDYSNNKEMRMTIPFCFNVCQTPTMTIIGVVVPHHNMDASGIWSFFVKFLLFARLPKILWKRIFRMCKDTFPLPSMNEMLLDGDNDNTPLQAKIDLPLSPTSNAAVLRFKNYDPTKRLESIKLNLGCTKDVILQCRQALKASGVTISTAFTALSMKVMAHISQTISPDLYVKGPIVGTSPVDLRNKWRWSESGNDCKERSMLPLTANYAGAVRSTVAYETLLQCSVETIASNVKQDIQEYQSDAKLRFRAAHEISFPGSVFCGVSSVTRPNPGVERLLRLNRVEITSAISTHVQGPVCWFKVVTRGSDTDIQLQLALPDTVLVSKEEVRRVVKECVSGTALEPLFTMH